MNAKQELDAGRYQWLRANWKRVLTTTQWRGVNAPAVATAVELGSPLLGSVDPESLDAAIDAAMRSNAGAEGTTRPFSFGDLNVIAPRDAETFVLHCDHILTVAQRKSLRQTWGDFMPGRKLLILERGLRLSVAADKEPNAEAQATPAAVGGRSPGARS